MEDAVDAITFGPLIESCGRLFLCEMFISAETVDNLSWVLLYSS